MIDKKRAGVLARQFTKEVFADISEVVETEEYWLIKFGIGDEPFDVPYIIVNKTTGKCEVEKKQ
ncbi:MAG: hypothetical protein IJJ29_07355 [Solobacterium sp.]|nr:hypothetical protein [Solobacterium sp.]